MAKRTPSGKLRGRVRIGVDNTGKSIYKYVSAPTRRELENAKAAVREHYVYGRALPVELPFAEYAEQWYLLKKEPFISEASRASYKVCFMKHLLPEFGLQQMRAISAAQIQQFVNGFGGASKSQITMVVGTLKQIFASACAEGMIDRDPTAALIRPKAGAKENRRALTPDETQRILTTIQNHPEGLFLAVLYFLGVRRGEALGLKWSDIDFRDQLVHIQRDIDFTGSRAHDGALKTAAADRFIPIPAELMAMLEAHRESGDGYLFHTPDGKPLSQNSFKRMWCRLMLDAGCTLWRDPKLDASHPGDILHQVKPTLTPHYFRHNYVTLLYESGIDPLVAMRIVGHTDYQTTANIYTHLKEETLRRASVSMEKVFRRKPGTEE